MPDITMCRGFVTEALEFCPLRNECYRFMAIPSEFMQSYFVSAPFVDDSCKHLIRDREQ